MTYLLSEADFTRASAAVARGEVTPELYAWLGRLVAVAQASRALAPSPLPDGRWDDPAAVAETVQAWLEESLLRGGLARAFDRCRGPRSLARYLERALRNWLVARSRRSSGPRLLERAGQLMAAEAEYRLVRDSPAVGERWWALADRPEPELFAGSDEVVAAAAWGLGDFALLRYPSSERSDPVLSTPDLRRFLHGLLERVGRALSGRHIDAALRARFAYAYAPESVPIEEARDLADGEAPWEAVEVDEAARLALARLSRRQLLILLERPDTTLEQLAARFAVSRGTIDNEYRRGVFAVREASPSDELFPAVLERVQELASRGGHGHD